MFTVTGEFITDHSRDRVFEYHWEDGLRFLSDTVPGLTYEQMVEVLSGRKGFDGDSRAGINLVDETPERSAEVRARYAWKYAGTFYDRSARKHWRPYAYVQGFSAEDMTEARIPNRYHPKPRAPMLASYAGGDMPAWGRFRCVRYMRDCVEDNLFTVQVPTGDGGPAESHHVLWSAVESPPLWWKQVTTPQDAVIEFLGAGGRLEERGANAERRTEQTYRDALADIKLPKGRPLSASFTAPPGPPPPDGGFLRELVASTGVSPETIDGLTRALTDTGEYTCPEPTRDVGAAKWAWVDRGGRLWPCRGYMDHIPLADAICRREGMTTFGNPSRALETAGWAKVGVSNLGEPYIAYVADRLRRTKAITEAGAEWLMRHYPDRADQLRRWVEDGDGFDY